MSSNKLFSDVITALENDDALKVVLLVHELKKVSPEVLSETSDKKTLLSCAIAQNRQDMIEFLIQNGANLDVGTDLILESLVVHQDPQVADQLKSLGFDFADSPLPYVLAEKGNTSQLRFLLDNGLDITKPIQEKYRLGVTTALHIATQAKNKDVIYMMMYHGASPNALNSQDQSVYEVTSLPELLIPIKQFQMFNKVKDETSLELICSLLDTKEMLHQLLLKVRRNPADVDIFSKVMDVYFEVSKDTSLDMEVRLLAVDLIGLGMRYAHSVTTPLPTYLVAMSGLTVLSAINTKQLFKGYHDYLVLSGYNSETDGGLLDEIETFIKYV